MHFIVKLLLLLIFALPPGIDASALNPVDCDCTQLLDTLYVTNTLDDGPGSLRCALNCANNDPDFSHIRFDLDEEEDSIIYLMSSLPVLKGNMSLHFSGENLIIDGSNLQTDGDWGFRILGANIRISGFHMQNFPNNAIDNYQGYNDIIIRNNVLVNNGYLSPSGDGIDFRLAGRCTIENNRIISSHKDGIYLQTCHDMVLNGNEIASNGQNGINIYQGSHIAIGDSCTGCSNVIYDNVENGIKGIDGSKHIRIFSNKIGVTDKVDMAMPNKLNGIYFNNCDSIQIGAPGRGNYISGNAFSGIELADSCYFFSIQNNYIGFSIFENVGIPNGLNGVKILRSNLIVVGGESQDQGNQIGYNPNNVYIGDSSIYCSVRHNDFSCSINGIFLEPESNENVEPVTDISIVNAFTLKGIDEPYTEIQAYKKNPTCNSCQGSEFLKSTYTFTGAWQLNLDEPLVDGDKISIVKTDLYGNTSVFSECIQFSCETFEVEIIPQGSDYLCEGSQLVLGTDIGNSFLWSTGAKSPEISIGMGGEYSVTVLDDLGCPASDTIHINTRPSPELNIFPELDTNYFCGSSTLVKASGEGFFQWDNGMTGPTLEIIGSGTYCVSLTNVYDCTVSDCVTMVKGEDVRAEIELIGDDRFCNGESTKLVASGGQYFKWNTGEYNVDTISVFQTGQYVVTVSNDAGCEDVASHDVIVYPSVDASIEPSGFVSICYGDAVTLTASEGSYFNWSTGATTESITVNELGVYYVTVENLYGCKDVAVQTVSVKPEIVSEIVSANNEYQFCSNDSILLFTSGATLDSIVWNGSEVSDSIFLTYEGLVTADLYAYGCSIRDSVEIIRFEAPEIAAINGPSWAYPDSIQTFRISNPVEDLTYSWFIVNGELISGGNSPEIQVRWHESGEGKVCVIALDSLGCHSESICHIVDLAPLNVMAESNSQLLLYPNPSSGLLTVFINADLQIDELFLEFFDPVGLLIHSQDLGLKTANISNTLDLSNIPAGVYWVKVSDGDKLIALKKLVVNP